MIDPDWRLFAPSGDITPGGPSTWHIVDWDQRRLVSVTMDEELDSEEPACQHLLKHIDHLAPNVYEIHVSPHGELISASTNPEDDHTLCVFYPPLETIQKSGLQVIFRSDLKELDRLNPNVDLVLDPRSSESAKKLIFKYYFMYQQMNFIWHEMNLWMRLPNHPNLVHFHKVVVDELEGRPVGFRTLYIPGGTLEEKKSRVFKLKWLQQLTSVIGELNLNLGIAHQDVAPRNLVIQEDADAIMLFDFNYSVRIGNTGFSEARNDINGVIFTMFEIITRKDLRNVRHEEQDLSAIQHSEWEQHPDVRLDSPVSEYRKVLETWSGKRRAGKQIAKYTDAPNYIDWPDLPDPPLTEIVNHFTDGTTAKEQVKLYDWRRQELLNEGKTVLQWERPPQRMSMQG